MPLYYAVPANQVQAGTFGAGDYTFPSDVTVTDTVLVGTTTRATGSPTVDILSTLPAAIVLTNSTADNTTKIGGMGLRHYDIDEENVGIFGAASLNGISLVGYGGGNASLNTVEQHSFYTAANDITLTGTEVFQLDHSAVARDTRMKIWDVDNNTLERVTVGVADSGGAGFKLLRIPN